ncbi:unnamed protein product [Camellia sinensis]
MLGRRVVYLGSSSTGIGERDCNSLKLYFMDGLVQVSWMLLRKVVCKRESRLVAQTSLQGHIMAFLSKVGYNVVFTMGNNMEASKMKKTCISFPSLPSYSTKTMRSSHLDSAGDAELVGLELPTIEVRFEHLTVDAEAYVGSRALPTIFNFSGFLNCLHILPSRKKLLPILHDVNGIINPGRMTLLLGPPSSGKTTLLLGLVSGKETYNGHGMDEFVPQRTSAYISQYDLHLGELTVRETLAFSARCQGVGPYCGMAIFDTMRHIRPDVPTVCVRLVASVHAYEQMNRVYNYTLDPCGPIYVTVGDGENIETADVDHADDKCPPQNTYQKWEGVVLDMEYLRYEFQMQYGSIGWVVGATLGYAQAARNKRVIASIGDGSFQVTAQDVSTMLRCEQRTIIFLIEPGNFCFLVDAFIVLVCIII